MDKLTKEAVDFPNTDDAKEWFSDPMRTFLTGSLGLGTVGGLGSALLSSSNTDETETPAQRRARILKSGLTGAGLGATVGAFPGILQLLQNSQEGRLTHQDRNMSEAISDQVTGDNFNADYDPDAGVMSNTWDNLFGGSGWENRLNPANYVYDSLPSWRPHIMRPSSWLPEFSDMGEGTTTPQLANLASTTALASGLLRNKWIEKNITNKKLTNLLTRLGGTKKDTAGGAIQRLFHDSGHGIKDRLGQINKNWFNTKAKGFAGLGKLFDSKNFSNSFLSGSNTPASILGAERAWKKYMDWSEKTDGTHRQQALFQKLRAQLDKDTGGNKSFFSNLSRTFNKGKGKFGDAGLYHALRRSGLSHAEVAPMLRDSGVNNLTSNWLRLRSKIPFMRPRIGGHGVGFWSPAVGALRKWGLPLTAASASQIGGAAYDQGAFGDNLGSNRLKFSTILANLQALKEANPKLDDEGLLKIFKDKGISGVENLADLQLARKAFESGVINQDTVDRFKNPAMYANLGINR